MSHNDPSWRRHLHSGVEDGTYWSPGMVDVPLRGQGAHNWFWSPGQDDNVYTLERLMKMYYESVGRNCNLVLGEVITPEGRVPESDIARLKEFGNELQRRFANPLATASGAGQLIELRLDRPSRVDHLEIMEDLRGGERIRSFSCEGLVGGDRWETLSQGTSVGHKRIQQITPIEVAAVRLRIDRCVAVPQIRRLAVYRTG